jgi:glycosyltransferase involved in cell wall biosynthesis
MDARGDNYWLVIPAYNEAATIRDLAQRALHQGVQVIVVDDASTDATSAQVADLPLTLLLNETNRGKAGSLCRGFEQALAQGASAVLTLDGDGQHRPEDIPRLIEAHEQNPQCIIVAARVHEDDTVPLARYRANCFANFWISWAAGHWIRDSQCGFRLYPAQVLRRVRVPHNRAASFVFESEVLIVAARAGFPTRAVPIPALYPVAARASHMRPVRDIARIVRMVAWKLLTRGMYLQGLYRCLVMRKREREERARTASTADARARKLG